MDVFAEAAAAANVEKPRSSGGHLERTLNLFKNDGENLEK